MAEKPPTQHLVRQETRNLAQIWWQELGLSLRNFMLALIIFAFMIASYLLLHEYNAHASRYITDGALSVSYPVYIPFSEARQLILRIHNPKRLIILHLPSHTFVKQAQGRPPTHQTITPDGWLLWEWNLQQSQSTEIIIEIQNPVGTISWITPLPFKVCIGDQCIIKDFIWLEGIWAERFRKAGQTFLLIIAGSIGYLWASFYEQQRRLRENQVRAQFIQLQQRLKQGFTHNLVEELQKLSDYYHTILQGEGGKCASRFLGLINRSDNNVRAILSALDATWAECPEWFPALLSWIEYLLQDPEVSRSAMPIALSFKLRALWPQLPPQLRARVQRLLQRLTLLQRPLFTAWPPAADALCILTNLLETTEKRARSYTAAHLPPNLFPETELDASRAQAQYWLFRTQQRLFWDGHPVFQALARRIRRPSQPGQAIVQVRGRPGHGRTALALAISRYFPFSEYFGVYLTAPAGEQDLQEAWAQRLLTFGCCHLMEWSKLPPEVNTILLHLCASVWPPALLHAKLLRCQRRWGLTTPAWGPKPALEAHQDYTFTLLQSWLHTDLPAVARALPLQGAHWWATFAEFLELTRGLRPWKGLIVAVDWTEPEPPPLEHWRALLAPVAAYWPVLWVLVTSEETPWLAPAEERYALRWRDEDLIAMLEHRKAALLEKKAPSYAPFADDIERWARQAEGNPRRLAVLYRCWYRQQARQEPDRGETHA